MTGGCFIKMNDYELDHIVKQCEYLDRLLKWNPLISIEMSTPKVEVSFMRKIWDKLWSLDSYKTNDIDKEPEKEEPSIANKKGYYGIHGNKSKEELECRLKEVKDYKTCKEYFPVHVNSSGDSMSLIDHITEYVAIMDMIADKKEQEYKQKGQTKIERIDSKIKELSAYEMPEGNKGLLLNADGDSMTSVEWNRKMSVYATLAYEAEKEKEETPKRADRDNKGKAPISMVLEAGAAITGAAKVLDFGAKKYSRNNYRKGLPHTEIIDCMVRHAIDYLSGTDIDADSGLPVVDHITANALFLAEMYHTGLGTDDRTVGVKDEYG